MELLGWADNAGPLPFSFMVAGILLGAALFAIGITFLTVTGFAVLGVVVALLGVGLLFGTLASRPS